MIYAGFSDQYKQMPKASWLERKESTKRALPSVTLAVLIVGGLYSGAFTPTEASAVISSRAVLITAFWLRRLTWQSFWEASERALLPQQQF